MPERDYSHRDVVDKLGVKSGQAVCVVELAGPLDDALKARVLERSGRDEAAEDEPVDLILATVDATSDPVALLAELRCRLQPAGGIWLLTPKRGRPGYVNQNELIEAGGAAGVVDNKVCSVSDTVSAMRFVIRRQDRA